MAVEVAISVPDAQGDYGGNWNEWTWETSPRGTSLEFAVVNGPALTRWTTGKTQTVSANEPAFATLWS